MASDRENRHPADVPADVPPMTFVCAAVGMGLLLLGLCAAAWAVRRASRDAAPRRVMEKLVDGPRMKAPRIKGSVGKAAGQLVYSGWMGIVIVFALILTVSGGRIVWWHAAAFDPVRRRVRRFFRGTLVEQIKDCTSQ